MKWSSVFIVDAHPLFRQGLRSTIKRERDMVVVGEAADGQTALRLAGKFPPDVLLMDLDLFGRDGLDVLRAIKREHPGTGVIVITDHDEEAVFGAIKLGAAAYFLKDVDPAAFGRRHPPREPG